MQIYPKTKCVAVDVDGTLITKAGELNTRLVDWIREIKSAGFEKTNGAK